MPLTDGRVRPGWLQLSPITAAHGELGDADQSLGGAWRTWERLRTWDRSYAYVVDSVLALGLLLMSGGWFLLTADPQHPNIWFVLGLTLPLVFRRRAPIAVFGVISLVALIQWSTTGPLLADSALLLALYTVASESHWVQVVIATVTLEVGIVMATVHWRPTGSYFKSIVFLTGLAFSALFAGVVVRALRSQMGWLAERAERLEYERDQQASLAAAAERARIAREMHDVVSHNIQVMVTLADAAGAAGTSNPERAAEAIAEVSGTGRQALVDMRRMLGLLRDDAGDIVAESPLAPQPGLGELEALIDRVRATGLLVEVHETGSRFTLAQAAQLTVYRIVQEALTNALKHAANPGTVVVSISYEDPEVHVEVTDDGVPNSVRPAVNGGGHGVAGMAERAAAFGGSLRAGPRVEGGWRVEATLRGCKAPVGA